MKRIITVGELREEARCSGKVAFRSKALALEVAGRRGKKGRDRKRNVYRCEGCGLFHLGTYQGRRRHR